MSQINDQPSLGELFVKGIFKIKVKNHYYRKRASTRS